jgi:superfamily I DNA/RNA helicase
MNTPSDEQKDIINHTLAPLSVIACAGSGKTFTAVRRVSALRGLLKSGRSHVALLSFSNAAVDVFDRSYLENLQDILRANRSRVCIETFDGFITNKILRPHASRTMESDCMPFLLTGTEAFLNNQQYQFKPKGQTYAADIEKVEVEHKNGESKICCRVYSQTLEVPNGIQAVRRLGKLGAYTHALGRYWAYETLKQEAKVLAALAHRYPQIVVDEAQDMVSMQVALLELLVSAGSEVTLIGDPNQAIFEFCGADGTYLQAYPTQTGIVQKQLTINYRSVPRIVTAANSLAQRKDTPNRQEPNTDNGAFFLPIGNGEESKLIAAFEAAIRAAGLSVSQSAVVCRAAKKKQALRNLGHEYGQGVTKLFVSATMARDVAQDYYEAFRLTAYAIVSLLKNPPRRLCSGILDPSRLPEFRELRKIIWEFTRNPERGLPSGSLLMQSEWHPKFLVNVKALLKRLQQDHELASQDNLNMRLKKTGLPTEALIFATTARVEIDAALRVETIHGVKGESLDAVLYLADSAQVKALVNGTGTEVGRIGYVALTRARNLFWLGISKADVDKYRTEPTGHTFVERQYDADPKLPLSST